jgi:hypothetical protein
MLGLVVVVAERVALSLCDIDCVAVEVREPVPVSWSLKDLEGDLE